MTYGNKTIDVCETVCADYDIKDFAGDYDQAYSNGHKDSTSVECNGNVKWRGSKLNGKLFLAGSKLPADRAAQNNDPNYKAADGWFFRPWDRPLAWEFVKFSNGQMFVHHFCKDQAYCNGKLQSPKGSGNFCCDSTSQRKPISCVGTFQMIFSCYVLLLFVCLFVSLFVCLFEWRASNIYTLSLSLWSPSVIINVCVPVCFCV